MKLPQLTFTRFVAASLVVFFHYAHSVQLFGNGFLHELISQGSIAVSYFFVLSGFVLGIVYLPAAEQGNLEPKSFFRNRFARIIPLYLLAFFLSLALMLFVWHKEQPLVSVLLQAAGIHAWVPGYSLDVNYTSWSVSVEFFFYLAFPFLVKRIVRMKPRVLLIGALLFWISSQAGHIFLKSIDDGSHYRLSQLNLYHPFAHFSCFVLGLAAARFFVQLKENFPAKTFVLLSSIAIIFILGTGNPIRPWIHNGLLAPLFLLVIIGLAKDRSPLSAFLASRPLVWLGEISFGIYLLQHPVELALRPLLDKIGPVTDAGRFFVYFVSLILISGLVYYLFESPMRKWIRGRG